MPVEHLWERGMLNGNNKPVRMRLINRIRKLYPSQQINCSLGAVEQRIQLHPSLFKRSLSKATAYAKRSSYEAGFVLWIACHLFDLMKKYPLCFYCGKSFNDSDFMGSEVQLEHFIPRSRPPVPFAIDSIQKRVYTAHYPHRIVLACPNCNGIKSNLSDKEFLQVIHDADSFFKARRYGPDRRTQLREFAELYYYFLMAPQGYAERHGIAYVDVAVYWEAHRSRYRARWH
jgi:5-methylcytosine-specific restriction endonuclease McrA